MKHLKYFESKSFVRTEREEKSYIKSIMVDIEDEGNFKVYVTSFQHDDDEGDYQMHSIRIETLFPEKNWGWGYGDNLIPLDTIEHKIEQILTMLPEYELNDIKFSGRDGSKIINKDYYAKGSSSTKDMEDIKSTFSNGVYSTTITILKELPNIWDGPEFMGESLSNLGRRFPSDKCDRCDKATGGRTTMSIFNQDSICIPCKELEKLDPDYNLAVNTERNEIKKGNYNYEGLFKDYKPFKD